MIHSGLVLNFRLGTVTEHCSVTAGHCCLRGTRFTIDITQNFWNNNDFNVLREINKKNNWDAGCENCKKLESVGEVSLRTGMNDKFGIGDYSSVGPKRIDLMFDISCNLACRTCGVDASTMWQRHLKEHNLYNDRIYSPRYYNEVITALKQLDLSQLEMLVFCGGETLLGQASWEVAEWLADNVPNAKQQLTLCFQTNGTQPILEKNYDLIDRFHLVKLYISLDGVGNRFNYLRWPADWNQVVDNIMHIRDTAPSNTMFLIEETISIFNLYYLNELDAWVKNNFITNREGDVINHTQHFAGGIFGIQNCTQQYVDHVRGTNSAGLISTHWKENLLGVQEMLKEIHKFDQLRGESFAKTFPEVAAFY